MGLVDKIRSWRAELPSDSFVRASIQARLGLTDVKVPGQSVLPNRLRRPSVQGSEDLDRILALPRRKPDLANVPEWPLEKLLRKENPACRCSEMGRPCVKALRPIQRLALIEAQERKGIQGAIGVGHGKELICELLPFALGAKNAVLLIPPDMREAFALDWEHYGQHWWQPNLVGGSNFIPGMPRLRVIAYSELSHEKFTDELRKWKPDALICNEAHNLCNPKSIRTRRLIAYAAEEATVPCLFFSGTLTKNSICNEAHLAALSLGLGSPYPLDETELGMWARAIDPQREGGKLPALMGALKALCNDGEDVRSAFKRRRSETPGVVDTTEAAIPAALYLRERVPPKMPEEVKKAIADVEKMACRPDGEEFTEAWQVSKCVSELSSGFYYRWIYPRGEDEKLIARWFGARQAWNREVRELLQRPVPHLDSPALAAKAAIRSLLGLEGTPEKPIWKSRSFAEWREVHKLVRPETQAVWISDWLARDAAAWGKEHHGIIWYRSRAFGAKVGEISGFPIFGEGKEASRNIEKEKGNRSIIASLKAHGTGKNLQYGFSKSLFAQMPYDAGLWEQHLGRTHRYGQPKDSVDAWIYRHCPSYLEAFAKGYELALFAHETKPNPQKLMYATYSFPRK